MEVTAGQGYPCAVALPKNEAVFEMGSIGRGDGSSDTTKSILPRGGDSDDHVSDASLADSGRVLGDFRIIRRIGEGPSEVQRIVMARDLLNIGSGSR